MSTMRVNISLPDDIWKALKAKNADNRFNVSAICCQALRNFLESSTQEEEILRLRQENQELRKVLDTVHRLTNCTAE